MDIPDIITKFIILITCYLIFLHSYYIYFGKKRQYKSNEQKKEDNYKLLLYILFVLTITGLFFLIKTSGNKFYPKSNIPTIISASITIPMFIIMYAITSLSTIY